MNAPKIPDVSSEEGECSKPATDPPTNPKTTISSINVDNKTQTVTTAVPALSTPEEKKPQKTESNKKSRAKAAILSELNSTMKLKAEKMTLHSRGKDDSSIEAPSTPATDQKSVKQTPSPLSRIPRSVARQRRRDTGTKMHGGVPVPNPSYTWNRGGRVKELRIRCLVRKYLHIWTRNTFGRVLPSVAQEHYNRFLLQGAFVDWYDIWWEQRVEWRLVIRAECHDRYRRWLIVWKTWRQFMERQKVKKAKLAIADDNYNKLVIKRAMSAWKEYQDVRNAKESLKIRAQEFADKNLLRCYWADWKMRHSELHQDKQTESLAVEIWAHKTTRKAWLKWKSLYTERMKTRLAEAVAMEHYEVTIVGKCFASWQTYRIHRRVKDKNKMYGVSIYLTNLMQRLFHHWHERFTTKQSQAKHQLQIDELSRRFNTRKMFEHWKHYIKIRKEKQSIVEESKQHYDTGLLRRSFDIIHLAVVQRKIKNMRIKLANEFHEKQVLRQTWIAWIQACEQNEELKLMFETRKAREHYRLSLLKRAVLSWKRYQEKQKHKQNLLLKADAFFAVTTVPKCFERMRQFVVISKTWKQMNQQAESFQRESIQSRYLNSWYQAWQQEQESRTIERIAIIHRQHVLTQHFFYRWKRQTDVRLIDTHKEDMAEEHYRHGLCDKTFSAWMSFIRNEKENRLRKRLAAQHYFKTTLSKNWNHWRSVHQKRRESDRLSCKADGHRRLRLLRIVFNSWRVYHQQAIGAITIADQRGKKYDAECLRWAIVTWRENIIEQKEERHLLVQADVYRKRTVVHRCFSAWHEYAELHAYKKQQTVDMVQETTQHLAKGILHRAFKYWCKQRDSALLYRLKTEQASIHHSSRVQQLVLSGWRNFVKRSQQKRLMARQSEWFLRTSLTAKYFLTWKNAQQVVQEENSKTALALWQWSLNLQSKVFNSWKVFVIESRRKRTRYETAMDERRRDLISNGLRQWLQMSSDMIEMRTKWAAQRQAKTAYGATCLVQRYARRWRQITAKRKAERGGAALPPRSKPSDVRKPIKTETPPFIRARQRATSEVDLRSIRSNRPAPRRPAFLIESLKREGLYDHTTESVDDDPQRPVSMFEMKSSSNQQKPSAPETPAIPAQQSSTRQRESTRGGDGLVVKTSMNKSLSMDQISRHSTRDSRPLIPRKTAQKKIKISVSDHNIAGTDNNVPDKKQVVSPWKRSETDISSNSSSSSPRVLLTPEAFSPPRKIAPLRQREKENLNLLPPSAFMWTKTMAPPIQSEPIKKPDFEQPMLWNDDPMMTLYDFQSPADELLHIKNQLQKYRNEKQRLELLKSQYDQLSALFSDVTQDTEMSEVFTELKQMEDEVTNLQRWIETEKPRYERYVKRARSIVQQTSQSERM